MIYILLCLNFKGREKKREEKGPACTYFKLLQSADPYLPKDVHSTTPRICATLPPSRSFDVGVLLYAQLVGEGGG